MQSCMEKYSMDERHEEIVRSDYNQYDQYSITHPDAHCNSGQQGKGTGHGGHGFWLPNCTGSLQNINAINYSNFDTGYDSHAGNCQDNLARETSMARSLYSELNPYGMVDTSANVAEGQYVVHTVNPRQENCRLPY